MIPLIVKTHDAALRYLQHNKNLITHGINPYVFFIPYINFAVFPGNETFSFFRGFSFVDGSTDKFFVPSRSRTYYLFHPAEAFAEMNSSVYIDVWRKCLLGKFFIVYRALRFAKRHAKSFAKKLLYLFSARHIGSAVRMAEKCEVISFDVFDTLVKRKCLPVQVFDRAEEKYNARHSSKIHSFRELRVQAEITARRKSGLDEVTFSEIYDELANELGTGIAEDIKPLEFEAEFDVVYASEEAKRFYALMKEKGKRIVITSDMYLPAGIIAEILRRCGYDGYEALYVSSEFRARKSSGGLFRKAAVDLGVKPSEILHIGDNMHSDYIMAKMEGLNAFLCRK